MAAEHVVAVDLARVFKSSNGKGLIRTLAWGDYVEVLEITQDHVKVKTVGFTELSDGSIQPGEQVGFIKPPQSSGIQPQDVVKPRAANDVLKVNFVDVQQGDATVIETPQGKVILVDGGDNQLFARYLANRYRDTTRDIPREIECIVVSHGDADHFQGLTRIFRSEREKFDPDELWKRLFVSPNRVFHNGLVKRPSGVATADSLGASVEIDEERLITGLVDNLLDVADDQMNTPFRAWKAALRTNNERRAARGQQPIAFRRLARGDDDAFDFLRTENIDVEVLGPIPTTINGVSGLRFLGEPVKGPRVGHPSRQPRKRFTGESTSHTINGHSIVLRLKYGGFRFLLAGDLNEESEEELLREHQSGVIDLTAEVFKVPHHGSDDFSVDFVKAVSPVVSVISSGDESARKEYIHPRATLIGALGRHSRLDEPVIFVTEMVAFFNDEGFVIPEAHVDKNGQLVPVEKPRSRFYAFRRTAFGLVKIRTDGRRLLVNTDSGNMSMKETYAYGLDQAGAPTPARVRQA